MLKTVNNIYIPTVKELATLNSIMDNKEKLYDYIVVKLFETKLETCYQNNKFSEVPLEMMDILFTESDLVLLKELKKALIKTYPDILYNYDYLGDAEDVQIAIQEFKRNSSKSRSAIDFNVYNANVNALKLDEFLSFILELIKNMLEESPKYRFEYKDYESENDSIGFFDCIFNGSLNTKNIDSVKTLRNVLYIDPIYLTKLSEDQYKKIYKNSGINISDVKSFQKRDAVTFVNKYVDRNKVDGDIWSRNYDRPITDKDLDVKIKQLIRQR